MPCKIIIAIVLAFSVSIQTGFASTFSAEQIQKRKISGTVVDTQGSPIPGASVTVKGTTVGIVTDTDGKYSLEIPANAKDLVVTFVGYEPQAIKIGTASNYDVKLSETTIGIEEVVAVGYGVQRKVTTTGAVTSTTGKL